MQKPPRLFLRFLRWFCREDYLEEIEGDLTEVFEKNYPISPRKAKWKFAWSVFKYFRPEFIRSFKATYTSPTIMFRHNLLITYRSFLRYKSSFFINLIGLSSGLACTLLIYLWVMDELSIDKFHEKDSQLFQVFQTLGAGADHETIEYTPGILAKTLAEEMPEVELAAAIVPSYWFSSQGIISAGDTRFKVAPQYVSKDFFNVFTYPLVDGNKVDVLVNKQAILLSESLCMRLFQTTRGVIGKNVQWSHLEGISGEYFVTGIFKDAPSNSTAKFDVVFSYELFLENRPSLQKWANSDPCTYVILKKGTDLNAFNAKIKDLKRQKTQNPEEGTFEAQQFSSKYLYGHYQLERGGYGGSRIQYVQLFSVIAIFILAIACINFMNLSTARASRRLKEIGIKKAVGAGRKALVYQYLGEAMVVTALALVVSIALVYLLLPIFNNVTAKHLSFQLDETMVFSLLGIVVITGLMSGSYPALYLSGFNPVAVLKGKLATSIGEVWMRRGLVIFQFTLSIVLIASVLVVYKQIEFIQSKNLGYNRDNIISFEMEWKGEGSLLPLLSEIEKIPGVINTSCYYHNLLGDHGGTGDVQWDGKDANVKMNFANLEVGFDFIETLGIEIAEGRSFSRDIRPEGQIVFNETAIRKMGITDPVGKTVRLWGEQKQIVGVVKDFNFESLYQDIKPCFLQVIPELPNAVVKIKGGTEQASLEQLEKLYHKFSPGLPFEYRFLDAQYQSLYAAEQRVSVLSRYFAGIAILISCLGLFGLAAFTAERRVKEIGIRKILGATNFGIVGLLSGDFTKMVMVAIFVALPVSYLIGLKWLESFAYKVDLEWWFFIVAGFSALLIAWITVSLQTLKAARTNPCECLRNE